MGKNILKKHKSCSVQKTARKKHKRFEKYDHFKNLPSWKGYSPRLGYGLCKVVSLGQKLKMPKTSEKRFYLNMRGFLYKKPLEKKQIFGNRDLL